MLTTYSLNVSSLVRFRQFSSARCPLCKRAAKPCHIVITNRHGVYIRRAIKTSQDVAVLLRPSLPRCRWCVPAYRTRTAVGPSRRASCRNDAAPSAGTKSHDDCCWRTSPRSLGSTPNLLSASYGRPGSSPGNHDQDFSQPFKPLSINQVVLPAIAKMEFPRPS